MGICWWASSIFGHLVQNTGWCRPLVILPCVQKKNEKSTCSILGIIYLLVTTSNNQYFEEITVCEWFDVIFSQKCVSCIPSLLWARQNGKMVCLAVLCSFFDFFELALGRNDSRVGRKLVKGVSEV